VVKTSEMEPLAKATRTALQAVKEYHGTEYEDLNGLIYYYYNDMKAFYYPQAPTTGYHATYQNNLRKLAWYYAVWQ